MLAYETTITVGDVSLPEFVDVVGKSEENTDDEVWETKAYVIFNKAMDLGTLSNPENYLVKLDNGTANGTTRLLSDVKGDVDILKGDGEIVLIEATNDYEIVEIGVLGVKDTKGKKLSNYGEMKPIGTISFYVDGNPVAKAKDTVEVTFNMPVKEARTSHFSFSNATVKEVSISGKKVTLKLDKKLQANAGEELTIKDVVPYVGDKLDEATYPLVDKIAAINIQS